MEDALDDIGNVFGPSDFTFDLPPGWREPTPAQQETLMRELGQVVPEGTEAEIELAAFKDGGAGGVVLVSQEEIPDDVTLEEFATGVRENVDSVSAAPIDFGDPTGVDFAGDEAVFYDYDDGTNEFRTLITIHDGYGATIEMAAPLGDFDATLPEFEQILASWSWSG